MAEVLDAALVRSGTWGQLWLDGELAAECYGCQIKLNKTKEDVARLPHPGGRQEDDRHFRAPGRCGSTMPPPA